MLSISNKTLSIIIPTIGRFQELNNLLNSIVNAKIDCQFEVILIDQNNFGYINPIIEKFKHILNINHQNVNFRGLSMAKNFGVKISSGEILCFPDDDCEFHFDTVLTAFQHLDEYDIVFGKCIDRDGNDSVIKFKNSKSILTLNNMDGSFVEATLFAHREVFDTFLFDESMGAGCFHGAEEGFDWLYRLLKGNKGYKILYSPNIRFYHPQIINVKGDNLSLKRVFSYRCGFGKLCRKNKLYSKFFKRFLIVSISLPIFLLINKNKFKFYLIEFFGLITGVIIK